MQRLGKLITTSSGFFLSYLLFIISSLLPQLLTPQDELFMHINRLNAKFLDVFFYWLTYLGDGVAFLLVIIILLFFSYSKSLTGLVIFLATSLVAQLLKRVFFDDSYRPVKVLTGHPGLHIPEGVTTLANNSFPSGHTVTAFALATFLVLLSPGRKVWVALLIMAILVGYSRIYLTHHFPIDVWAGSLIGTTGALVLFWLSGPAFDRKFGQTSLRKQ